MLYQCYVENDVRISLIEAQCRIISLEDATKVEKLLEPRISGLTFLVDIIFASIQVSVEDLLDLVGYPKVGFLYFC